MKKSILIFLVIITVIFIVTCSMPARDNPADKKSPNYQVGIVSTFPADGTLLTGFQDIVVQFSDPINTGTLSISGAFAGLYDDDWGVTVYANDTLTLSPLAAAVWSNSTTDGVAQTLSLSVESENGIESGTHTVDFTVRNAVCVSEAGNNSNPGTADEPMATIAEAITAAGVYVDPSAVLVSVGNYTTSSDIEIVEGISLYGDYSTDFRYRNVSGETAIRDDRTVGGGTYSPNSTYSSGSGITRDTKIDGFTINGGGGDYSTAVLIENDCSIIIENNIINGGNSAEHADAIFIINGSPIIRNNQINFGEVNSSDERKSVAIRIDEYNDYISDIEITGNTIGNLDNANTYSYNLVIGALESDDSCFIDRNIFIGSNASNTSYNIYIWENWNDAEILISNNLVFNGGGAQVSDRICCIYIKDSSPEIFNNTIISGNSSNNVTNDFSAGIYIELPQFPILGGTHPDIKNNLISFFFNKTGFFWGIVNRIDSTDELTDYYVQNNSFYSSFSNYYYPYVFKNSENPGEFTGFTSLEGCSDFAGTAENNTYGINPNFTDIDGFDNQLYSMEDNDWSLNSTTSPDIYEGGYDGSLWIFDYDFVGDIRTEDWSIGAYEFDI